VPAPQRARPYVVYIYLMLHETTRQLAVRGRAGEGPADGVRGAKRSGAEEERRGRTCSTLRETACPMIIGSKLRSCRCGTAACAPLLS
jgi:hypothetical protein